MTFNHNSFTEKNFVVSNTFKFLVGLEIHISVIKDIVKMFCHSIKMRHIFTN